MFNMASTYTENTLEQNIPKCYKWLHLVNNVMGNLKCSLLKYAFTLSIINMSYFKTRKKKRYVVFHFKKINKKITLGPASFLVV